MLAPAALQPDSEEGPKNMFATVLIGTDLSAASDRLIACLPGLHGLGTREVILVHALGLRHLEEMKHALAPLVEPRVAAQREAIERLGFRASLEIAPGIPAAEIHRVARERAAALILLGSGSSGARELLLGSVTVQVLHRTDIPVLVCHCPVGGDAAAAHPGVDLRAHLLHATDFSAPEDRALGFVEQFARAGAKRVTLVQVQHREPADRGRLDHLRTRLLLEGADEVSVEVPTGVPGEEIVRIATEQGASLVVMGTTGRGSASAVYLGSVSHRVVRHSPVPVLLVPPHRGDS